MPDLRLPLALAVALLALDPGRAVAEELGDPTRPAAFQMPAAPLESGPGAPIVTAILIGPGRRSAVVNGVRVEPGDEVAGGLVREILPYAVRLETSEGDLELRIAPAHVKRAAARPAQEAP